MSSVINDSKPSISDGVELTDLSPRTMIVGMIIIFGIVLVTGIFIAVAYKYPPTIKFNDGTRGVENQFRTPDEVLAMPSPRNFTVPGEDLAKLRAEEQEFLHSYAWVDKGTNKVRIPIDRAIDIIAEKGLPAAK